MIDEDEIHRMANSADVKERRNAAKHLDIFAFMYNKEGAWEDLHRLTQDEDSGVRWRAADMLGPVFSHIPDKDTAWADLHRLIQDGNEEVRGSAVYALGSAFSDIPDKDTAWADLHRLTQDEDELVRGWAAGAFCFAFSNIPDKDEAWSDLHRLTQDEGHEVRGWAASALGSAFSDIPNTDIAWSDLHRLTQDEDYEVRGSAASALGSAFSDIPDTDAAWSDLHRLIETEGSYVQIFAYHSLGSASVYKATETEDEEKFRDELKKAIDYFESSSRESVCESFNPAQFCLPFYRSFYAVISRQEAEAEATKYLDEAKKAAGGSENRKILLKAVENLANALKEAQKPLDFDKTQKHLRACRLYCDHTAELADSTRGKSPVAAAAIMRGIPIVGVKVKEIIAEIKEKAKTLCKQTKDTPLEILGLETNERAKQLSNDNVQSLNAILETVLKICDYLPFEKKTPICMKIQMGINLDDKTEKVNIIQESLDSISNDISLPRLNYIHISETNKNIVRIATIQLNFQLTGSFPPTLIERDVTKNKILSALETAKNEGSEIACLPELSIHEEWVEEIRNQFSNMIIIPGSYYDSNNYNTCKLSLESDISIQPQRKITPSAFEDSRVMSPRMTCGEKIINIYQTKFGKFAILICRDFGNFIHFLRGKVDIVFVPSYNSANARFHKDADSHITNSPSYVIISNTSLYGGTSIFGQLDFKHFNVLEQGGCKKKGDCSYKLCEIEEKKEGLIIADFNLIYKSPQRQTPINPEEEIISVANIRKIYL